MCGGMAARRGDDVVCCMCGDYGLALELFRCKRCQFRSQHRYCSNIYPEVGSYGICNWCLSQKDETVRGKEQKASTSSGKVQVKIKIKKSHVEDNDHNHGGKYTIGKQKSSDLSPLSGQRRRITTDHSGKISPKLRRTRSEEMTNGGIKKHVFRNKAVRRYKHLNEVSSQ